MNEIKTYEIPTNICDDDKNGDIITAHELYLFILLSTSRFMVYMFWNFFHFENELVLLWVWSALLLFCEINLNEIDWNLDTRKNVLFSWLIN